MERARDRDFVDVQRELIHWRSEFLAGNLPAMNYAHEVEPVVKLACDIYTRNPHGCRADWQVDLGRRLSRNPTLRGNRGSGDIATLCWNRLAC